MIPSSNSEENLVLYNAIILSYTKFSQFSAADLSRKKILIE